MSYDHNQDHETGPTAFPLAWPHGWPRTANRKNSRFAVSRATAVDSILHALKLMGCKEIVISTDVRSTRHGTPLAGAPEPQDSGVAVYWVRKGRPGCIACDRYHLLRENMRAISQALDGLRAIERSGASQVLEQIFSGLRLLSADIVVQRPWRTVLGFAEDATVTRDAIEAAFLERAHTAHPDRGGTHEAFVELNTARSQALDELKGART